MSRKNNRNREVQENFIPDSKCSNKEKRRRDRERRGDWGGISPVTKIVPNKKKEKKKKRKRDDYYDYYDEDYYDYY